MRDRKVERSPVDETEAIRRGQLLEFVAQQKQGGRRKSNPISKQAKRKHGQHRLKAHASTDRPNCSRS